MIIIYLDIIKVNIHRYLGIIEKCFHSFIKRYPGIIYKVTQLKWMLNDKK